MTQKELLSALINALRKAEEHVVSNSDGSFYTRGLITEGYVGGYIDALHDVMAVIRGVTPRDTRKFWR